MAAVAPRSPHIQPARHKMTAPKHLRGPPPTRYCFRSLLVATPVIDRVQLLGEASGERKGHPLARRASLQDTRPVVASQGARRDGVMCARVGSLPALALYANASGARGDDCRDTPAQNMVVRSSTGLARMLCCVFAAQGPGWPLLIPQHQSVRCWFCPLLRRPLYCCPNFRLFQFHSPYQLQTPYSHLS